MKQKFTLVELILVVAIIAILISILLPSLTKARNGAIRTQCLSNLKQVGTAIYTYNRNHDGMFPYVGYWMPTTVSLNNVHFSELPYLLKAYTNDKEGEVSNLLACPGFKKTLNGSTNPKGKFHFNCEGFMIDKTLNYLSGFGVNPQRVWGKPVHNIPPAYRSELAHPSMIYGFYELIGKFDGNSNKLTASPFHGYRSQTPVRNTMFMDGSAATKLWLPAYPYR